MSRAFGPKGVRARLVTGSQLPAHGPAPPRVKGGGAAGWKAERHRRERGTRVGKSNGGRIRPLAIPRKSSAATNGPLTSCEGFGGAPSLNINSPAAPTSTPMPAPVLVPTFSPTVTSVEHMAERCAPEAVIGAKAAYAFDQGRAVEPARRSRSSPNPWAAV